MLLAYNRRRIRTPMPTTEQEVVYSTALLSRDRKRRLSLIRWPRYSFYNPKGVGDMSRIGILSSVRELLTGIEFTSSLGIVCSKNGVEFYRTSYSSLDWYGRTVAIERYIDPIRKECVCLSSRT